ncbi:hypothetical protein Tco_0531232 [Tanacetum coccineum]
MSRTRVAVKTLVKADLHITLRVCHNSLTVVKSVEVRIIVLIVKQRTRPSMIRVLVTIKILMMTNLHFILQISNNSLTVVRSVEFTPPQLIPLSELERKELITYMLKTLEQFNINQENFNMNVQAEINRLSEMPHLRNSNQDPPVDLYDLEGSDERDIEIDSLTKEPLDTLLMGDEVISTTPARKNNEFIKSSVDGFVTIPRESEVTSISIDLECGMPIDTPPSPYLVVLGDKKIDLLLRDDLDTLLTGDREIDFNPSRDIEELECLLANDHVPIPRVFDEPLGNSDSMSRSIETSGLILEELIIEIGLDDSIPIKIDDGYYDLEGGKTRVMETPFLGFHYAITPSCCILTEGGDVLLLPSSPHIG